LCSRFMGRKHTRTRGDRGNRLAARELVQLHRRKGFGEQFARGLHGPVFELAVVELRAARGARHRFVSTGIGTAYEIAAATLRTLNAEIHDPPRWLDAAIGPALRALGLDCSGISIVHRRLRPSSAARHTTWSGRPWPPLFRQARPYPGGKELCQRDGTERT